MAGRKLFVPGTGENKTALRTADTLVVVGLDVREVVVVWLVVFGARGTEKFSGVERLANHPRCAHV